MTANKIIKADFLDLLFDNRNKLYGAYMLRKGYKKRLWTALAITLFTVIAALSFLRPSAAKTDDKIVQVHEVVLTNVEQAKPPPPPPPVKEEAPATRQVKKTAPAPSNMAKPQIKTTKFTPPVIKKDKEVQTTEMPPVNEIATVDVVTTDGISDDLAANISVVNTSEGIGNGKGIVPKGEPKKEDANKIFEKVEIEASVDIAIWRRHLERNLVNYIENAVDAGIPPGTYTVIVHFLVERDGSIAQVRTLNNPGYGLAEGAVQVVKSGPNWNPGEQNGRKVRSYHTQPVSFVIMDS
jgi:protein TonB